ncbi:MAG: hypothetical protein FWD76_05315 [Firmicutes bacterium]|nr:hypothetical protein [Bacillota bacterium]
MDKKDEIKSVFDELQNKGRLFGTTGKDLVGASARRQIADNIDKATTVASSKPKREEGACLVENVAQQSLANPSTASQSTAPQKIQSTKTLTRSGLVPKADSLHQEGAQSTHEDDEIATPTKGHHIGRRDRMRKRAALDPEFENFAPHEILEILLYAGIPRVDTNEIAHALILEFGTFSDVFYASTDDLMRVKGMTKAAVDTIKSVLPIARFVSIQNANRQQKLIQTTSQAVEYLKEYFENKMTECVYLVCLDAADYVLNIFPIANGAGNVALIDSRQIVSKAHRCAASKAILAHNHPSGTLCPSLEDIATTSRVAIALNSIFVTMIDHLIFVPSGKAYSFYESNILMDILEASDEIVGSNTMQEVYCIIDDPKKMLELKRQRRPTKFLQSIYELAKERVGKGFVGKDVY